MSTNEKWFTAREVAAHFKVKEPTIRLYTKMGMPCLRFSRSVRFDVAEVERWLRKRNAKRNTLAA
jgi:hypothetical protein